MTSMTRYYFSRITFGRQRPNPRFLLKTAARCPPTGNAQIQLSSSSTMLNHSVRSSSSRAPISSVVQNLQSASASTIPVRQLKTTATKNYQQSAAAAAAAAEPMLKEEEQLLIREEEIGQEVKEKSKLVADDYDLMKDELLGQSDTQKATISSNHNITTAQLEDALVDSIVNSKRLEQGLAQWKRFPVLNKFLGGFRPGEFTVLTGPTGVGKTTFLTEYTMDICLQGVPTLFCSFEMPNIQILKKILIQAFRTPLDGQGAADEESNKDLVRKHVQELVKAMPKFWLFNEDRQKYEEQRDERGRLKSGSEILFRMIADACEAEGVRHLVIDNLQYMLGAEDTSAFGGGDRFQRQDVFIRKLRQLTHETGIHITLVVHPRKESGANDHRETRLTIDSVYGGGRATQEADNVLIVQKPSRIPNKSTGAGANKKYLWIVKNRYCGTVCEEDRLIMDFNGETKTHSIRDDQDHWGDAF